MAARLDARWQCNGLRALVLDNPHLQVALFPEAAMVAYSGLDSVSGIERDGNGYIVRGK